VRARLDTLRTPPVPRIVPDGVFDAFGWCASDTLTWGRPGEEPDPQPRTGGRTGGLDGAIDGGNPERMVFVMHAPCTFLPRELARLHAFGLGLEEEWALAPYAIDDATDLLFEHRVRPRDILWLAADNLNALVWGLHDWAHFHNHGPFEERAWTELQCDATALAWLWINRDTVGIDGAIWERARHEVGAIGRARFEAEGKTYDDEWLGAARVKALAESA
jgi:hypothetical protein